MKRRRFFNTAGEKRKFYNNLRHFGQTRNLGIACMGLLPLLGVIGLFIMCAIAVAHLGNFHAANAVKGHRVLCQTLGALSLGAVSLADIDKVKKRMSLEQKKADLLKANNNLMDICEAQGRDFTPSEDATFKANMALVNSINDRLGLAPSFNQTKAKQVVKPENNPGAFIEVLDRPRFASMGEQLRAVVMFKRTSGAQRDPRLIVAGSSEWQNIMAAAGMNESIPSDGGFLLQSDLVDGLIERIYESGELLQYCNQMEISSPSNRLKFNMIDEVSRANGSRFGGVQSFWTNEAQSITATKPKFRQGELILNKLMAVCFATDEMVQDVAALNSVINTVFPQEFIFRLEDGVVNGPGDGQPAGFMGSGALIVVPKDAAQATATLTSSNVFNMYSRLWGPSRKTSVWLIDQSIEPQLYSLSIPGAGSSISTPIYLPPGGISGNMYGTLFGRPVIPVEYLQPLGSQGDIVLADLQQYILARKGAMQIANSMHVNFLTDEQCFRFTMRADGQTTWNQPLTPKSGAGTLSPFVTLAARP